MSNPYFKFKEFTVYHDRCAMKVGTDGVLLGAWTQLKGSKYALDIGTGTGLIALMLSQRSNQALCIDAIDIDEDAVIQARENVERSEFQNVKCKHVSIQDFSKGKENCYDLIVSNPPYFTSSLLSPDSQRTLARHTVSLELNDFMSISSQLLSDDGRLSMIFPYEERENLVSLSAKNALLVSRITNVLPTPSSKPKRILLEFSKKETILEEDDLILEQSRHAYSKQFTEMVKDFYLNL